MRKIEIGVSTNCNCGKNTREIMQNIKASGFGHIMFSEKESDIEFEEVLSLADQLGLRIQSVHGDYGRLVDANALWVTGEENEKLISHYTHLLELCAKHGIQVVCMHPAAGIDLPPMSPVGVDSMKQIVKVAEKAGVKIAIENLGITKDNYLSYLLDHIDSPMLGFCYDSGHAHNWYPDFPLSLMERYGNRCYAIHLHDNLMDAHEHSDCRDFHLLPFDGKIDFTKVMQSITNSSYDDIVMMELKRSRKGNTKYDGLTHMQYLGEALQRGERLAKMIKK